MARLDQILEAAAGKTGKPPRQESVETFAGVLRAGRQRRWLFVRRILLGVVGHCPRDWTESMQGLKILVILLGVVILAGVVVVGVTIFNRAGNSGGGGFGSLALALPKGCHLIGMVTAGDRLALRLGDSAECQVILFVDPHSGQQTGSLALQSRP
jgi:hypothetical protein